MMTPQRYPTGALVLGIIAAFAASMVGDAAAAPATPPRPPRFSSIKLTRPTAVDMRQDAGATGDGVTDDSAVIQAAIERAPNNARFYFPAGTYRLAGIAVSRRSRLEFYGDGPASILQWSGAGLPSSYTNMMTFTGAADILIRDLAFDNRSIPTYGGVVFYATKRVEIRDTTFGDSDRRPPNGVDRYAFVFGRGSAPHSDLKIHGNRITNLQLEVDHARRVEIRNNTVTRGTQTASIGVFSLTSGTVAEDYLIDGNLIIDPEPTASGIAVHLDPPSDHGVTFRRIRISNNSILFNAVGTIGISVGTPYTPAVTVGNVFEDIAIEGNRIRALPSAPPTAELLRVLSNGRFTFGRLTVRGNALLGNGQLLEETDSTAQIRYARRAVISDNVLRQAVNGFWLVAPQESEITGNDVGVLSGAAYGFTASRGRNVFRGNRVTGTPSELVVYHDAPHPTDRADTPTTRD